MKAFRCAALAAIALILAGLAGAQVPQPTQAADFNSWVSTMTTPITAAGSASFTVSPGYISGTRGEGPVPVLTANGYITFDTGANAETLQVTSVACTGPGPNSTCTGTATFGNTHAGSNTQVSSGTGGVQEAVIYTENRGGGWVMLAPSVSMANISFVQGYSNVTLVDARGTGSHDSQYWSWRPSAVTLISAPAAPTVTATSGSLTSGTFFGAAACVDALGGVSLPSTSNNSVTTATGLIISAPTCGTGSVGWLPYYGGTDGAETLATNGGSTTLSVTSSVCAISPLVTTTPACKLGANATVTTASSATSKLMVEGNAFSTWNYIPANISPLPTVSSYPFGVFVVGSTINNSNEDLAQFQVPAGYFNQYAKGLRVCVKGATATQVASSTLTIALNVSKNYGQSPVTLGSFAFATQTQAAAGTQAGCVEIIVSTTGTSGKFFAQSTAPWTNTLNSTPHQSPSVAAEVSAAASSAIDLSKELWFSINYAEGTGDNITAPIVNQLTVTPIF